MKRTKKIASVLMALVMVLAMAIPAFAASDNTLTIEATKQGHEYEVYQVFQGTYANDGTDPILSNITWGSGINYAGIIAALKTSDKLDSKFAAIDEQNVTAAEIAKIAGTLTDEEATEFAKIIGANLSTTVVKVTDSTLNDTTKKYEYKVENLADGYYFVKDAKATADYTYTNFILKVVGDVTVVAKDNDVPVVDKNIVVTTPGANDGDPDVVEKKKANQVAVGDTVAYEITTKVPSMVGFDKFFFIVSDTLSKGLTFNDDIVVTLDGTDLIEGTDYYVEDEKDAVTGVTAIKVVFKDFYNKNKDNVGKDILVTYTAILNEDAVVGNAGNPNDVNLIYSNNPNVAQEGKPAEGGDPEKPDEPKGTTPIGETPKSTTYTYVTGIELIKVDGEGNTLEGAEFEIAGTATNKVIVVREQYVVDPAGTYYKLKDGTYTTDVPDGSNDDEYESTTTKYAKKDVTEVVETSSSVKAKAYVGVDGKLVFEGLSAGEYTITEITAPDGYNLLSAPIKVVISWEAPANMASSTNCTWTATVNGEAGTVTGGIVIMNVVNEKGTVLPETGGVGTTLFYILGAVLVAGAIVLLVTKKRMSAAK